MCSRAYDMDSYKWLDKVNSQVCEQRNNSLRKMAKSLAHMKFINYIRSLTLYFSYTNLKIKKIFNFNVLEFECKVCYKALNQNDFLKTY